MKTYSYILLENIRFYAYHGVAPQERTVGNEFVVNIRLSINIAQAVLTDEVTDTVNYASIYQSIKSEMEQPSNLLEHVCGRIVRRVFDDFPQVEAIEIKLSKRNPPMAADIDAAGVEMHCSRN